MWGGVVNRSRDVVRQVVFIEDLISSLRTEESAKFPVCKPECSRCFGDSHITLKPGTERASKSCKTNIAASKSCNTFSAEAKSWFTVQAIHKLHFKKIMLIKPKLYNIYIAHKHLYIVNSLKWFFFDLCSFYYLKSRTS